MRRIILPTVILLPLLLLIVFWLGSSYYCGLQAERHFRELAGQLAQDNPNLHLTVDSYQRGILHSRMNLTARLDLPAGTPPAPGQDPKTAPRSVALRTALEVDHGPVGLHRPAEQPLTSPVLASWSMTDLQPAEGQPPLPKEAQLLWAAIMGHGHGVLGMDGSTTSWLDIQAQDVPLPDEHGQQAGTCSLKPGKLVVTTDAGLARLHVHGRLEGLEVTTPGGSAAVRGISPSYDATKSNSGLFLGSMVLGVETAEFHAKGTQGGDVVLRGAAFKGSSSETLGLINVPMRLDIASIEAQGRKAGPAVLDMTLANLDAASLVRLQELSRSMQPEALAAETAGNAAAGQEALQAQLQTLLPRLQALGTAMAAKSPSFRINELSLTMPEGRANFTMDLSLAGDKLGATATAEDYLMAVNAQGRLTMAQPLAMELAVQLLTQQLAAEGISGAEVLAGQVAGNTLASILDQGLMRREGQDLVVDLAFRQGQASLNGQLIDLPIGAGADDEEEGQ